MTQQKLNGVAPAVGTAIITAEKSHRGAVLDLSALKLTMIEAHQQGGMRFVEGHGAISDVAKAEGLMIEAWFHIARAHQRAADVATKHGIPPAMWGDGYDTPPLASEGEADITVAEPMTS